MISNNDSSYLATEFPGQGAFTEQAEARGVAPACRTILFVDDEPCIRELTQRILETAGYFVTCAEDGEVGRELLCERDFDVLVTDHCMPRLSGMGLLRWLRREGKRTPVILISGNIPYEEPDFKGCLFPGIALEKPFSCSDLLGAVEAVWALASVGVAKRSDELFRSAQMQAFSQGLQT